MNRLSMLVLSLLPLLSGCLVRADAAAPSAAAVATVLDLVLAINNGTEHVIITDHLTLASHPLFGAEGTPDRPGAGFRALFEAPPTLKSLRGDCATPPPAITSGPPLGDVAEGQCVLTVDSQFLYDATPGKQLWLHNLHVRYDGAPGSFEDVGAQKLILMAPFPDRSEPAQDEPSAGLWLTSITLAGEGTASGAGIEYGFASLFAADSRFTGLARSAVSCGTDSPCALERCAFEGNAAGDDANVDPYEYEYEYEYDWRSAALDVPIAARARAQGCSFAGGGDDANVDPGAALYTDLNATLTFSAATRGAVLPLACATEDVEALSADAPAFVALREEADAAAARAGISITTARVTSSRPLPPDTPAGTDAASDGFRAWCAAQIAAAAPPRPGSGAGRNRVRVGLIAGGGGVALVMLGLIAAVLSILVHRRLRGRRGAGPGGSPVATSQLPRAAAAPAHRAGVATAAPAPPQMAANPVFAAAPSVPAWSTAVAPPTLASPQVNPERNV